MIIGSVVLLADSSALALRSVSDTVRNASLLDAVAAAVDAGVRTVIVRDKDRPRGERAELCRAVARLLESEGGTVIAAEDTMPDPDDVLPADGVHLAAAATWTPEELSALADRGMSVSQSCHTPAEAAAAGERGALFVTASPVYPTASKPGYGPPLGVDGLRAMTEATAAVTVALGGVTEPEHVTACLGAGAVAAAVMGAILGVEDPGAATARLLSAPDPEVTAP